MCFAYDNSVVKWVAEKSCNIPIGLILAGTLVDILQYGTALPFMNFCP